MSTGEVLAPGYVAAFFVVAYLYATVLSLAAILMEEISFHRDRLRRDTWRLVGFAFLEAFGYRQLTVWFRLKAFVRYVHGDYSWGRMKREGFGAGPAVAAAVPEPLTTRSRLTPVSVRSMAQTPRMEWCL